MGNHGGTGRKQGSRRKAKNVAAGAAVDAVRAQGFSSDREAAAVVALTERYGLEVRPDEGDAPLALVWKEMGTGPRWAASLLKDGAAGVSAPVVRRMRAIVEDRRKHAMGTAVRPPKETLPECFRCGRVVDEASGGHVLRREHAGLRAWVACCIAHERELREAILGRPMFVLNETSEDVLKYFPGLSDLGDSETVKPWRPTFVSPSDGQRVPTEHADVLPALELRRTVQLEGAGAVEVRAWVSVLPPPGRMAEARLTVPAIEAAIRKCEESVRETAVRESHGHFSTALPISPDRKALKLLWLEARWVRSPLGAARG